MKSLPVPRAPQDPLALLHRMLDSPEVVAQVRSLPAPVLQRLISQIGLEDCGELIALATPEQLVHLMDTDLWRSSGPGQAESFDAERFGLWLQVMQDLGPALAAQKILDFDPDFTAMAFSKQVLVLAAEPLRRKALDPDSEEDFLLDKILEGGLHHEFADDWVISKNDAAWDALLELLLELENSRQDFFQKLMKRLRGLSQEQIMEHRDVVSALTAGEQLESDLDEARETRREQAGFVTPVLAAQFLSQARLNPSASRPLNLPGLAAACRPKAPAQRAAGPAAAPAATWIPQLEEIQAELKPGTLVPTSPNSDANPWPIRLELAALAKSDPGLHDARLAELAHLANLLMAGCSYQGRRFRPAEAALAAIATANLGLESWFAIAAPLSAGRALAGRTVAECFNLGWSRLHQDVCLYAARRLERALADPPTLRGHLKGKTWIKQQWESLRTDLAKGLKTGKPWQVMDQLLIMETLIDAHEVRRLLDLLDECPTYRPDLNADAVFIHTPAQVKEIQRYADAMNVQGNHRFP